MNMSTLLSKTRKELESAKLRASRDHKSALAARQTAKGAKAHLKQMRKLAKSAKKAARKAEDQAEESLEALEEIKGQLESLETKAKKEFHDTSKAGSSSRHAVKPRAKASRARLPAKKDVKTIPVSTNSEGSQRPLVGDASAANTDLG